MSADKINGKRKINWNLYTNPTRAGVKLIGAQENEVTTLNIEGMH